MAESRPNSLYTIGHSNHSIERFLELLGRHEINAVVDVRSSPHSRYCPQFNRKPLARKLTGAGIEYVYMGRGLGARPQDPGCYDNGHVSLERAAERSEFTDALKRLRRRMGKHRVALMCAEKDPLECHRTILICRNLKAFEIRIRHILADGSIEEHEDAERRLVRTLKIEPNLFEQDLSLEDLIERAYDRQGASITSHATTESYSTTG